MPEDLFAPFQLGDPTLANRVVMVPVTRNRADENGVAPAMMETYYEQRTSAGLIITDSAPVSAEAQGYGGSVQKRMRSLNEILDAVCGVWSASRVSVRLTPENSFNSMSDSDPQARAVWPTFMCSKAT